MTAETQYIHPQGFDAARFGFTDKLSTNVDQWLSKCTNPALRSAVESVFYSGTQPERLKAAAQISEIGGMDQLPSFLRTAIDLATSERQLQAVVGLVP